MRCRAIGERSNQWCERRAIRGERYCPSHKRSRVRTPLPPAERTPVLQFVDEVMSLHEPEVKQPPPRRHVTREEYESDPDSYIFVCGTDAPTLRCSAMSKRSRIRCKAPAVRGRKTCRFHGGRSSGPKNTKNCGKHFYRHGRETIAKRAHRTRMLKELGILKRVIDEYGI